MFKGLTFVCSGKLSMSRKDFEGLIKKNGGGVASSVSGKVTHLVTTSEDFEAGENSKIQAAQDAGIHIVGESFVSDSVAKKALESESKHLLGEKEEEDAMDEEEEEEEGVGDVLNPDVDEDPFFEERMSNLYGRAFGSVKILPVEYLFDIDPTENLQDFEKNLTLVGVMQGWKVRTLMDRCLDKDQVRQLIIKNGGVVRNESNVKVWHNAEFLVTSKLDLSEMTMEKYHMIKECKRVLYTDEVYALNRQGFVQGGKYTFGRSLRAAMTEVGLKWYEFAVFENISVRNEERRCVPTKLIIKPAGNTYFAPLPYDVLLQVFEFLDIKEFLATSLLSRAFYHRNTANYWKCVSIQKLSENIWIPKVDLEIVNPNGLMNWLEFYQSRISPLLKDKKIIEDRFIKEEFDISLIKGKEDQIYKVGVFCDSKPNPTLKKGASKFGGKPDLPKSLEWPEELNFLAQINLSEASTFFSPHKYGITHGILYFFVDYDENETGKVLFYDGPIEATLPGMVPDGLERKYFPQQEIQFFETISFIRLSKIEDVIGKQVNDLPTSSDFDLESRMSDVIHELVNFPKAKKGGGNAAMYHCLFGNDFPIQDSSTGDDEVLLFQIDSDTSWDACWGDVGCLYYSIKKDVLLKKPENWSDQIGFEMQCS